MHQGQLLVDQVFRYEDLNGAMAAIGQRLALTESLALPRTKQRAPEHRRPYADFYSDESREIVEKRFESVIRRMGYAF